MGRAWAGQIRANMSFGTTLPAEPPSGTAPCPGGRVRLGVFFDGTNNNAWRDWGRGFLDWKPGSSAPDASHLRPLDNRLPATATQAQRDRRARKEEELCAPTNVAKLYYLFKEEGCCQKRVYATGVGGGDASTAAGDYYMIESATGLGGRARIDWGIAWVTDFVNRNNHHLAIEKRIDTFGFSRGATQARDFLNKVVAARIENRRLPPCGHRFETVESPFSTVMDPVMPEVVRVDTYPEMRGILFEYLGIMDTVASEGAGVVGQRGDSWAGYNLAVLGRPRDARKTPAEVLRTASTHENVVEKEGWVHQVLHQVADDEFRDVFASEVMGNAPDAVSGGRSRFKHLPRNMREMSYPGCHADIGGGYRNTSGQPGEPATEMMIPTEFGAVSVPVAARPTVAQPMFLNISTLTLKDMVTDALSAGVPFNLISTLPAGMNQVDLPAGTKDLDGRTIPGLTQLYEQYCTRRSDLIKKHAGNLPKWADYMHDVVHAPVCIQSYPDAIYRAIAGELRQSPAYQQLHTYYVHDSSGGFYRWVSDPLRRIMRRIGGNDRDLNIRNLDVDRQRDVHYHGFQNSYDEPTCDSGSSLR